MRTRKMTWKYRNFIHSRILPGALMRGKRIRDGGSGPKRSICGGGLAVLAVLVVGGFYFYNRSHTFTEYVVTSTDECLDIDGTEYVMLGKSVMKYSPDGVFCVNTHNEANWSIAYSMQTRLPASARKQWL